MDKPTDVKMFSIGKLHISRAALIALSLGILASIIILIVSPNVYGAMVAIYILLVAMLVSYNINCNLLGHCKVFAWVLTVLYTISLVSSVAFFTMQTFKAKGTASAAPKFSIKTPLSRKSK